jgi:hypothetical protein
MLSVGNPLCPYPIAYGRAYDYRLDGLFKKPLRSPLCGGYEGIFGQIYPTFRYLIRKNPPYVPTVLPTVGAIDYPIPGCSRNPFEVRCVDRWSSNNPVRTFSVRRIHRAYHARLLDGVKRFRSVHMYAFDF